MEFEFDGSAELLDEELLNFFVMPLSHPLLNEPTGCGKDGSIFSEFSGF